MLIWATVLGLGVVAIVVGWFICKGDPVDWWLDRRMNRLQARLDACRAVQPDDPRYPATQHRIPGLEEEVSAAARDVFCHMGYLVRTGDGYRLADKYAQATAPPAPATPPAPASPSIHPVAAKMATASAPSERIRKQVKQFGNELLSRLEQIPPDAWDDEKFKAAVEGALEAMPEMENEAKQYFFQLIRDGNITAALQIACTLP